MTPESNGTGEGAQNGDYDGIETNGARSNGTNGHSSAPEHNKDKPMTEPATSESKATKRESWSLSHFRQASSRPLPTELGDGSYRNVIRRPGIMEDLRNVKTLMEMVMAKLKGETQQDDKTMIMERTIQMVATMPNHSARQEVLTNLFIDKLWNSLDHPPLLYHGDQFRYRQPDGSNNNPLMPKLGAAGTPYSRSVKPGKANLGALPDPETVYEAVMARKNFKKNPNNVSSILWYWATIVIHDIFWTDSKDGNINNSSSYLDLSPLYGNSKETLDSIRTFKDGTLKPDAFADRRLLGNPPGVCILLIMFNRFHNHIAENLAAINENNRFPKPTAKMNSEETAKAWKKYDEDLFQTARLITSGLYINITLVDYVRNIINLNRVDTEWTLDPRQEMGVSVGTSKGSDSGVGNAVSAEFNLCYRWHSCISQHDDEWIQTFFKDLLGDNYGELNLQTLMAAVKKFEMTMDADPGRREFGGFSRGPDGRFNDDELVDALATAIEQPGGAFGAQNVPRIMKPIEILGIIRGRKWNVAGLNEFRKHFGLKAYETFEDINSDPDVADSLRNLYQHPDHVELYPGLVAEEGKTPMVPGVGIAPTYTISRVVLSDAVALVRGDRHYTTDYHPGYLTQWGYGEANYDLKINHGCIFYKLFLRAFPNHFDQGSVYAHYPMVIPSENRKILTDLNRVDGFTFDRPRYRAPSVRFSLYDASEHILRNEEKYIVNWQQALDRLVGHPTSTAVHSRDGKLLESLIFGDGWKESIKNFYSTMAERLLDEKSYRLAGKTHCDLVRDVGNLAHTHFVAQLFNLPLKSKDNPKGVFSEQELYTALATVFAALFVDLDPVKSYGLKRKAKSLVSQLGSIAETNVKLTTTLGLPGLFTAKATAKDGALSGYGVTLIKGLSKAGLKADEITWGQIIPTAGAFVPNEGQSFAQAVDFYLSASGRLHLEELHRIASEPRNDDNDALLLGYALEGVRLSGPASIYRKAVAAETVAVEDSRHVRFEPGQHVFVSPSSSARSASHFPNPDGVDPRRPLETYLHYGAEPYRRLAEDAGRVALVELTRAVFKKKGLRRVAGPQGELKSIEGQIGDRLYMTEDWGGVWPFPTAMKVSWDDE
ncbi:heme peroxidase [Drechmeria coniospora]|uniref:Heme peroxidase n=1 Tax=Drechmeria coniospora TaxID=98403 RepID=A0A151GUJ0_DRECN|nr:heme peroxidase [Drechmeria coniospora]KYK60784.1 heme peroxidase [Drechmeria coniospora]